MKKRNAYLICVLGVIIIVTVLSAYMGYSIYANNNKMILSKIVEVEMSDLSETISYDLELGKDIDNIFGLEDNLNESVRLFNNIESIYVTDKDGRIFGKTRGADEVLPDNVNFQNEEYVIAGRYMYCIHEINDELRIVSSTDTKNLGDLDENFVYTLINLSVIGGVIMVIVIICVFMLAKSLDSSTKLVTILLAVWVFSQGAFICFGNYKTYNDSIDRIENTISDIYAYDIAKIEKRGIDPMYIGGQKDYLKRFIVHIDEISEIDESAGELIFTLSKTYMNRVIMGYMLQTLLVFIFSMIILGEYRIFISDSLKIGGPGGSESD